MPNTTSIDDKFKFLLSCIRWSDKGVIDFKAVAAECDIVSRAAASKRYSRLMKEHGINHRGSPAGNESQSATPKTTLAKSTNKRKLAQLTEPLDETDEEEEVEQVKKKSAKKSRKTSALAAVKEEGAGMSSAGNNSGLMHDESIAVGFLGEPEETSNVSIKTEEHENEV